MSENNSDLSNDGDPVTEKVATKASKENLYLKKQNTYVV